MFSTSCHYGLQAMIFISLHATDDYNVELNKIASEQNIPKHFLSKILQMLVKNKLLVSMKGPTGGFNLSRPADEIVLIEVVEAIDGLDMFTQCGIGLKKCDDDHPCPIHQDYKKIRERIQHLFETKTLKELSEDVERGDSIVSLGEPIGDT